MLGGVQKKWKKFDQFILVMIHVERSAANSLASMLVKVEHAAKYFGQDPSQENDMIKKNDLGSQMGLG